MEPIEIHILVFEQDNADFFALRPLEALLSDCHVQFQSTKSQVISVLKNIHYDIIVVGACTLDNVESILAKIEEVKKLSKEARFIVFAPESVNAAGLELPVARKPSLEALANAVKLLLSTPRPVSP